MYIYKCKHVFACSCSKLTKETGRYPNLSFGNWQQFEISTQKFSRIARAVPD